MDGLSGAASVIAVIDLAAKMTTLCFQYSIAVKDAKKDIERLQRKIGDIRDILEEVRQLLDGPDKTLLSATYKLSDSLKKCLQQLEDLKMQLEPKATRKIMSQLGFRALRWPFTSKEVEKHIANLESYEQTYTLALQADQTRIMLDSNRRMNLVDKKTDSLHQKINFAKLPVAKGASFNSHIEEHNATCLANTRSELQRQITEWANDGNGKSIFWLNGMAGTGKSTIARTIAQSFADKSRLGASFFFKKGEGDRGTANKFFTTIATELVAHVPGLIPGITKAINADPDISEKTLKDQFEKLIFQPFLEIQQPPPSALGRVIIIDALDECEREEDIQVILHLLAQTRGLGPVSLRIFVTSRPELPIRLGFKQMLNGTYQDLILQDIPNKTIEHDIALFFEHELRMVGKQRSLSLDWPSQDQIKTLVEMAIPLFIFAATACRYIGDKRDNPKKRLDNLLQYQTAHQVSRLDKIYLLILNQLFDDEDELDKNRRTSEFREVVGSIIVLHSPLSIFSLAQLLNIPKEDISCSLDLLHSVLSIPVDENMPIRLLHLSFRDFLPDTQRHANSPFWIDEKKTHERLASKCLQLLSSPNGLRPNICNLKSPGALESKVNNQITGSLLSLEVQYACRYWVDHLEQSRDHICDGDQVDVFLRKYFLYWLEAMSLMGEVSTSIRMINRLQSLTKADERAAIFNFLHDGKRFVLRNQSILEDAPLQLYSSALIFAPGESIIRTTFKDHIRKWITRLPKVQKDWNALLQTLEGHSDNISTIVFSPDGQLIASASKDKTIRLWDAGTGFCRSTLKGHSELIKSVVFSPDGNLLASASHDMTVRLWDAATGSCRSTLKGHRNFVNAVVFSPDGQLLASMSDDGTVRLWDACTGSCRSTFKGHSGYVNAVVFSPDGQLLISVSDDTTIWIWNADGGSCLSTLEGHLLSINVVVFSPDGQLVASVSDDMTVRLWNVDTGSCRSTLKGFPGFVKAIVFSPDGKLLASASYDGTLLLWDTLTGSCRSTLQGHSQSVNAVVFSRNGQLLASASDDGTIRLWDAASGSCRSTFEEHSLSINVIVFSPDGQLLASASDDGAVQLWDTGKNFSRKTLQDHSSINAVVFSPDGKLLASVSDHMVRLWDTATGSCRSTLESDSRPTNAVVFSPDSKLLAFASQFGILHLWNEGTFCRKLGIPLLPINESINVVVFSPNGQLLASDLDDGTVQLWRADSGYKLSTFKGHSRSVNAVVFSPNSQLLASASDDKTIRLWEVEIESCRSTLEGHLWSVNAVAFSPNGHLLASVSNDMTVRLWDAGTGSCLSTLEGHSGFVNAVVFSPDGYLLASASNDGTVRLWDAGKGSCRSKLQPGGTISRLAFSSDGPYLESDRGNISIPVSLSSASCRLKNRICAIFVEDQWLTAHGHRFLWLPSDYRPTCTAVFGNVICLGHASGNVTFLGFGF